MSIALNKYKIVLIEEGLGNLGSCFYYTREALEYAADNKVFEGKKCYANHPDAIEAKTLPERSVRDIIGYFEKTHVEDGPAGQALLVGTLCMPVSPDLEWARVMVESSIDTAGKFNDDFVGFSINASGASEEKDIDSFMAGSTLPISAQPKLIKAKAEGVTEIEVCSRLVEAVSCDLVTEAGAGGKALSKILESEKKRMALKKPDPKLKKTKNREAEDGADDTVDGDADDSGADHPDEQQDIELIKSLLKQYVGSDDPSEEECQAMHQAHENAKEMGLKGKEAEAAAGYSMKMAKHMAQKQAEAEEAGDDAPPAPPAKGAKKAPPAKAAPADADADDDTDSDPQESEEKKESRFVKQEARIAMLESKLASKELNEHIEKSVRESGLPKEAQKKFRECLGKVSDAKEVSSKLSIFKEAFGIGSPSLDGFNPEKSGETETGGMSFADCVKKD